MGWIAQLGSRSAQFLRFCPVGCQAGRQGLGNPRSVATGPGQATLRAGGAMNSGPTGSVT